MSEKIPAGVPTATSPAPTIDSVAKNSWAGGTGTTGTTSVQEALNQKHTNHPVNPSSMK